MRTQSWIVATLLVTPLVSLLSHPSLAAEEELFFEALPMVVSVSRLAQRPQDLPASVTVIDRQMIEASGAQAIPELLRLVPGFQVGHSNMLGPRVTATYHGASDEFSRRMQVLIDGRSVYSPLTGSVDWHNLPIILDDIERIEVTRGPNGASYGANAFLGAINIITYHPSAIQGTTIKVTAGDNGATRQLLRHAGNRGTFDYRVSIEHTEDAGFDDFHDDDNDLIAIKDDKNITNLNFRGDFHPTVNDYLTFQFGINRAYLGDGVVGDITEPLREYENERFFEQVKWQRQLDAHADIELQLYHIKAVADADYALPKLSELFPQVNGLLGANGIFLYFDHADDPLTVDQGLSFERFDIEAQHRVRLSDALRIVWGGEARLDINDAPNMLGAADPFENHLYRLFINSEWQATERLIVNGGVMAENNELTDTHYSPRLSLNYRLHPRHSLRLAYTQSYRTPAALEEFADYGARFATDGQVVDQIWQSAGELEPEEITAYELGLSGETEGGIIHYDVRLFQEQLRNLIATPTNYASEEPYSDFSTATASNAFRNAFPPCGTLYSGWCRVANFANDGWINMQGIDLQLQLRPSHQTTLHFAFSHVNQSGEILGELNPTVYDEIAETTPSDTLAFLIDQRWPQQWRTSLGFYQVGEMTFIGGDPTGGITTADLRIAKGFKGDGISGTIALTVNDFIGEYHDLKEETRLSRVAYLSGELNF